MPSPGPIHVIGGGLAGSEAAWQIACAAFRWSCTKCVPVRGTDAHKTGGLAELVCSNSFRSDDAETQRRRPAASMPNCAAAAR
jgi:methylenetetrahydrofolate--tRNA-(uracil-5-)-methyltransferase